jgi:hypothetical protein
MPRGPVSCAWTDTRELFNRGGRAIPLRSFRGTTLAWHGVCGGYGSGMPEYVTVRTENGDVVPFELDDDYDGAVPAGRRWDNAVDKLDETLERGVERAKVVARSVITKMRSMPPPRPDKVAVELGLKVTGTSGVAIAKCSAEAHIKITVEWQPDSIPNNSAENS